ncbi:MAG: WhiB family transcriptional regulator [Pseudonocardiaceae bacterium]
MKPVTDATAPAWLERGVCVQVGGDMWFPEKGDLAVVATCKKVCARCPVRVECLEWAMDTVEAFGIFGGLTVLERRKLRRKREAA